MDYEQKYKHALDLAKQVHDTTISKQQKENIEIIFPELKESGDDEEIVKLADEYYDKVLLKECGMEEKEAHHCRISYIHGTKAILERQKQKSSNWNEEDEERFQSCLYILQVQVKGFMGITETINTKWLKSLKQRYTWKPSDGQMEALWCATEKYLESDNANVVELRGKVLESLYNELKKLKGE